MVNFFVKENKPPENLPYNPSNNSQNEKEKKAIKKSTEMSEWEYDLLSRVPKKYRFACSVAIRTLYKILEGLRATPLSTTKPKMNFRPY